MQKLQCKEFALLLETLAYLLSTKRGKGSAIFVLWIKKLLLADSSTNL